MSNVKAGVAYVDVRLGSIEQFKNKLKSEIENATQEASKRVGEKLAKDMAPAGTTAGKTTAGALSKAFFQDANASFKGGLRALFTGQFGIFSKMMTQAGIAGGLGIRNGFEAGVSGISGIFRKAGSGIKAAAVGITNSVVSGFRAIPGHIVAAGKAVDAFGKRIGFLAFQLQGFGIIATVAFTAPVAAAIGFATVVGIKTAASIEQATASLKALTPAGTDVEALIKRLQKLAQQSPIFNTTDIVTFTQKMVASGLSVQKTEAFLKGFGNVALTVGADVNKIPLALEAVVQMVGKGRVSMEELRQQLGDALPGAMKLVANGLGVTTSKLYEMVEAGDVTGEDIVAAFTRLGNSKKYLDGAGKSADTLASKWQALKESLQTQLGNTFLEHAPEIKKALDGLGPPLSELIKLSGPLFADVVKGLTGMVKWIADVVKWYKELSPAQKDIANKLMLFAVILGPLVLLGSGLGMIIAGLTSLFAALATPVGLVILAIIGVVTAGAILYNMFRDLYNEGGRFKEWWDNFWAASMKLIKPVKEEFKKLWSDIKESFNQIKNSFAENEEAWKGLLQILKWVGIVVGALVATVLGLFHGLFRGILAAIGPFIKMISSIISGAVKFIGGLVTFITGLVTGDFGKMKEGALSIWHGLWDLVVGTLVNAGKTIWAFISNFVKGFVDFWVWLYDVLVGHSIIPDMVNAILGWFKKMVDKGIAFVKSLGKPFVSFYNDYIKPFINGVSSGSEKALNFIKSIGTKIKNVFSSAGSWLIDAGKNIVNGLIDGVKKMAGTLKNAILNLIPKPVRGIVADALGIASPSKVFMEYGKNVVLGFIQGVTRFQPAMAGEVGRAFAFSPPPPVSPFYGDSRNPAVDTRVAPKAAVLIENYHENGNDPDEIAEDLWFKIQGRGGGF